jgi:hypothetical protein
MLIEDWRPKMFCKDIECQNLSINGRVFFLKKDISIIMRMMRRTYSFTFENSKYAFRSPTGLIKDFHEEFDTIPEAKYVIRHKLHYVEQLVLPGTCLGIWLL